MRYVNWLMIRPHYLYLRRECERPPEAGDPEASFIACARSSDADALPAEIAYFPAEAWGRLCAAWDQGQGIVLAALPRDDEPGVGWAFAPDAHRQTLTVTTPSGHVSSIAAADWPAIRAKLDAFPPT